MLGAARAGAPAGSAPRVLGTAFEHVDLGAQADVALDKQCLGAGALFVAVGGGGTTLLVKAASGLVQRFGAGANAAAGPTPSGGD